MQRLLCNSETNPGILPTNISSGSINISIFTLSSDKTWQPIESRAVEYSLVKMLGAILPNPCPLFVDFFSICNERCHKRSQASFAQY